MTGPAVSVTVNGRQLKARSRSGLTVLRYLRSELGLTGARQGCESGGCGACTVLVDGVATQSCQMSLAAADGCEIETIEAFRSSGIGKLVTSALIEARAAQCGYCLPGIVATAVSALNAEGPNADLRAALERNICRCGTQHRILTALDSVSRGMSSQDD